MGQIKNIKLHIVTDIKSKQDKPNASEVLQMATKATTGATDVNYPFVCLHCQTRYRTYKHLAQHSRQHPHNTRAIEEDDLPLQLIKTNKLNKTNNFNGVHMLPPEEIGTKGATTTTTTVGLVGQKRGRPPSIDRSGSPVMRATRNR